MIVPAYTVPLEDLVNHLDDFAQLLMSQTTSDFLVLPVGNSFIAYPEFSDAYEVLKRHTIGFQDFVSERCLAAFEENPLVLVVVRSILGMSPPEWAYLASSLGTLRISQGSARSLEMKAKQYLKGNVNFSLRDKDRITALFSVACALVVEGADQETDITVHRLAKVDTVGGIASLRNACNLGVPYSALLYERMLGRPFAAHRDAVSEIVGDAVETAVESCLLVNGISYRKTRRAERLPGFDQAPDFIIPDEANPRVVIEAKIAEDDGTARDKITRIQHLAQISLDRVNQGKTGFEVIACISGRGFSVRKNDIKKLLIAVSGKVFTLSTIPEMIQHSELRRFSTR